MAWISPSVKKTLDFFFQLVFIINHVKIHFEVLMLQFFYHSFLWDKYTGRDTCLCLSRSSNPVTMFRHFSQLFCVRVKLQSVN